MSTQFSNHRDTPLRRFNAFWWGLAYFGIFGFVSALVYWKTGAPVDAVAQTRAADRQEVRTKVDAAQAELLPATEAAEKMTDEIKGDPQATDQFVPGSASHKRAMELLASGGDEAANEGFKLYTAKACNTCHGADANRPISPAYPKLGGQNAEYLLAQIKDIHNGTRTNGGSAVMKGLTVSMNLTEDEMKKISDWIATLDKPDVVLPEGDGKNLYMAKACATCHGPDANTPIMPAYPRLAGQNSQYLYDQMKAIKDGTRTNGQSAVMKPMMMNVSEEEMKILADWIAGQN
jgi:cytochrome c